MSTDASQLHTNPTSLADQAKDGTTSDDALKQKAGAEANKGLRGKADALYQAANALKNAVQTAKGNDGQAASNLAAEVGASDQAPTGDPTNLRQALAALADAQGNDLTEKAREVKEKYYDVKSKFEAVQKQKDKYTKNKGQEQYPLVVEAWNAFNTKYNYVKFDKHAIDGGHERRRFNDAPEYDVDGGTLGSRLKLKAGELQTAATELKDKAQNAGVSELSTHKYNAQKLASEAQKLAANSSGEASNHATSVIDKFNNLEIAYDGLGPADKPKVKSEFEAVKHIYDRMLNVTKATKLKTQATTIKSQAGTLYGKANTLAGASGVSEKQDLTDPVEALKKAIGANERVPGLQKALSDLKTAEVGNLRDLITRAQEVINKYNAVKSAYQAVEEKSAQYRSALTAGGGTEKPYTDVVSKFGQLEGAYNKAKCKAITPIFDKEWIR
ncbi:uncharacterized protein TA09270 [Theileria annulata]|uniref:Uncharacterized protein n=1 Tax=Theileria annulata TaxID=5874 RepID=Q4UAF3_THEAN|nr:uncharacterized protein TA09270 [Theileria annulata]CAI76198.1 hypothetical protein, conserved [Theileria annulata]|eukprot:XP_952823.1 hypothetical protein, conserved [Theileria annulata]